MDAMRNYANPSHFLDLTARLVPGLAALTAVLLAGGLYMGAMAAPDYQQGYSVKIMYVHVPAAIAATTTNAIA